MIKGIQQSFAIKPQITNYQTRAKINFGQNRDEYISEKKQPEEKSFVQKHWGKILVVSGLAIGLIATKGKLWGKAKEEIKTKPPENPSNSASDAGSELPKITKDEPLEDEDTKALKELDKAIIKNPKDHKLYAERAFLNSSSGNKKAAIEDLGKAIKLEPKFEYHDQRALLYREEKEYTKALDDYNKLIELEPNNAVAHINRGLTYRANGQLKEAMNDYDKAIKLDPKNPIGYFNRASIFDVINKPKDALNDMNKALELNPNDTDFQKFKKYLVYKPIQPFVAKGQDAAKAGDHKEAIVNYTKAIELIPEEPTLYIGRAMSKAILEDNAGAIKDYTKAIQLNPDNPGPYINRGVLYFKLGDKNKAIQDCNTALKIDPENNLAYRNKTYFESIEN